MTAQTVILIGSILSFIGSIIVLLVNRRESLARAKNLDVDAMGKFQEMLSKMQDRNEQLYDRTVELEKNISACQQEQERLRNDLAAALVEVAELKEKLAEKNGYIKGLTDPLIKLEERQRRELL